MTLNPPKDVNYLISALKEIGCEKDLVSKVQQFLGSEPENPGLWISLATTLREMKCYHGALVTYDLAIARFHDPTNHNYMFWSNRGLLLFHWERYDEALISLEKALAIKPDYTRARFFVAQVYERLHDFETASKNYRIVLASDSNDHLAWNNLGICQRELRLIAEAENSHKRALELSPFYSDSLFNLALLYVSDEQFEKAKPLVLRCLDINPDDSKARTLIGDIERKQIIKIHTQDTYRPRTLLRILTPTRRVDVSAENCPIMECVLRSPLNIASYSEHNNPDKWDKALFSSIVEKVLKEDSKKPVAPLLFLSYKWKEQSHHDWVLRFATDLVRRGYRLVFDRVEIIAIKKALEELGSEVNTDYTRILGIDRKADDVPKFVATMAKCTHFVPLLTEDYRRCVEPTFGGITNIDDDGWVFDEWQFALRLGAQRQLDWLGIWRSGPVMPVPFMKDSVIDFRDIRDYASQLDRYFPPLMENCRAEQD